MIKKILTSLMFALTSYVSASVCEPVYCTNEGQPITLSYSFLKMGGGFVPINKGGSFGPAIALGHRFVREDHAVEVSFNWIGAGDNWYAALPKVLYLYNINPLESEGLYVGAGVSYGNVVHQHRHFRGISAEFAVGYEFNRFARLRPFIELDIAQSALSLSGKHHKTGPVVSLAWGVGF